jgi:hypothetical protein
MWRSVPSGFRGDLSRLVVVCAGLAAVFVFALVQGAWLLAVVGLALTALFFGVGVRAFREIAVGTSEPLPQAPRATATIALARPTAGRRDRVRAYRVCLDGEEAGRVLAGDRLSLPVEPGRHTLELRIDWARSAKVEVKLAEGETVGVECRPASGFAWVKGFLGRPGYIELRRG